MKLFVRDSGLNDEHYFIAIDAYQPVGNEEEVTDMPTCDYYGQLLIGEAFGHMDWKCQRDLMKGLIETKGGSDYSTYVVNLTASEKATAAVYVPTKIVRLLGYAQLVSDSGGETEAITNLDNYCIAATNARTHRYMVFTGYFFKWMGKAQALQAEDEVLSNRLKNKFIDRGVMKRSVDTVDGFEDWVQSTDGFVAGGLKKQLNNQVWNLLQGAPSNQVFCDKIVDCVQNGLYPIS